MHAAPSVRICLAADLRWHALVTACAAAAAANLAVWIASQTWQSPAAAGVLALVSAAVTGSLVWILQQRRNGGGVLTWDGAAWHWAGADAPWTRGNPVPGEPRVVIDLGSWVLLRFRAAAPLQHVVWLPLSSRQAGAAWPVWRTALFARQSVADPPTANGSP